MLRISEIEDQKPIDGSCQDINSTGGFSIWIPGEEHALAPTLWARPPVFQYEDVWYIKKILL